MLHGCGRGWVTGGALRSWLGQTLLDGWWLEEKGHETMNMENETELLMEEFEELGKLFLKFL